MGSGSEGERVLFDVDEGVATVTLNRPEKLNAVTVAMGQRIMELVRRVNQDDSIKAVVLTATGERAFCVGTDLGAIGEYGTNWEMRNRESDYDSAIFRCRKPVIAVIHGYCLGGGLELALNSDVRFACTSSQFGAVEMKLGWHGAGGVTQMLPRLVGYGHASEMILSGKRISGEEAYRIGLVEHLMPCEQVLGSARALAGEMAANPTIGVQVAKHSIRMALSTSLPIGLLYENDLFTYSMTTADAVEGRQAFLEKRAPHFTGSDKGRLPPAEKGGS